MCVCVCVCVCVYVCVCVCVDVWIQVYATCAGIGDCVIYRLPDWLNLLAPAPGQATRSVLPLS